jgi:hypothetical protein
LTYLHHLLYDNQINGVGVVERVEETRTAHKILLGKPHRKKEAEGNKASSRKV